MSKKEGWTIIYFDSSQMIALAKSICNFLTLVAIKWQVFCMINSQRFTFNKLKFHFKLIESI